MNAFLDTPIGQLPVILYAAVALGCACLFILGILFLRSQALPRAGAVQRKAPLTPNELEFLGRIQKALPDFEVWPQVAMGALLKPTVQEGHPQFWEIRRQFSQKICDYVIATKGSVLGQGVVAVIELDDRMHDKNKDARRDALLAGAGIMTVRYESRSKPSSDKIRQDILALAKRL